MTDDEILERARQEFAHFKRKYDSPRDPKVPRWVTAPITGQRIMCNTDEEFLAVTRWAAWVRAERRARVEQAQARNRVEGARRTADQPWRTAGRAEAQRERSA